MADYTPTESDLRQAYVEASGASMAQESYYAEQVAEFERGLARIKAEALREALLSDTTITMAGRALNLEGWVCPMVCEPGQYDECEDCERVCDHMARTALTAAIGDDDE